MAEYNLSQLNTITEVMPVDLMHIRVKKRSNMLGDEDRAILYTDFLAGFQLNRFLEKSGGTMTGTLVAPKIVSSGADAVEGTATQMYFGSSVRQTVIKSSALNNVQISNGTTSGNIYHTANKPTPNELGMRTNSENDSRFAIKNSGNTFTGRQEILRNNDAINVKATSANQSLYIKGVDFDNTSLWYVGRGEGSNTNVSLVNYPSGATLTLSSEATINKTLKITGQVQPSDFSNLDARFFTQTAANSRFAQLAGNNNFTGNNTFTKGSGTAPVFLGTGQGIALKSYSSTDKTLYIDAVDSAGTRKWYIGNGANTETFTISILGGSNSLQMNNTSSTFNKPLWVSGTVNPTDFSNFDSRYLPESLRSNLAKLNVFNNFTTDQKVTINSTAGLGFTLENIHSTNNNVYMQGKSKGQLKWELGSDNTGNINFNNNVTGAYIRMGADGVTISNKSFSITGQVQPSDWANIDSRYIAKSVESDLAKLNSSNTFTGASNTFVGGNDVVKLKSSTAKKAIIIRAYDSDSSSRWYVGNGSDNDDTLSITNYKGGASLRLGDNGISANKTMLITGQVQPSDWANIDSRYLPSGTKLERPLLFRSFNTDSDGDVRTALVLSGFIRKPTPNANDVLKGLTIHVSNSRYQDGSYSRGITFEHSDTANPYRLYTYGYAESLDKPLTPKKIYTEADKPTPAELGTYTSTQIDQKIAESASNSTDLKKVYPVGIVVWFNSNQNPNTVMADTGMTWTYLSGAVGRTIRVGAANGSDVTQTGGSDNVTLAAGNIPSHTHSFSATTGSFDHGTKTTSSFDHGSKTTSSNGAHTHTRGTMNITGNFGNFRWDSALSFITATGAFTRNAQVQSKSYTGNNFDWGSTITMDASKSWTGNTSSDGAHTHTVAIGTHTHTLAIGAHTHTVSGTTGSTGSGQSFSVANTFYRLMAWVRTA